MACLSLEKIKEVVDGDLRKNEKNMEEKIKKLTSLSYKNRFSIYYKPDLCLVRTYFKNGSQHKETDKTVIGAITKMIDFLRNQSRNPK